MYSDIADVYHEIFPLNAHFIDFISPFLGPAGSRILDLGCGPGDYIHLFSENHDAVGIDASPEMIRLAKSKGKGSFFQMRLEEIGTLEGPFSCIYCIGNSLSYLPYSDAGTFFNNVCRLLDNDMGQFVLQVVNWDRYRIKGQVDFPVKTLEDGRTFHRSYAPQADDTVLFNTRLQDKSKVIGAWSDTLYPKYSRELAADVEKSGLSVVNLYGDFEKTGFDPERSPAIVMRLHRSTG